MTLPMENKRIVCAAAVLSSRSEDTFKAAKEISYPQRNGREKVTLSLADGLMLEGMQKRPDEIIDMGSHNLVKPLCLPISPSNGTGTHATENTPSTSIKSYSGTVLSLLPEEMTGFIRTDQYRRIKLLFQLSESMAESFHGCSVCFEVLLYFSSLLI